MHSLRSLLSVLAFAIPAVAQGEPILVPAGESTMVWRFDFTAPSAKLRPTGLAALLGVTGVRDTAIALLVRFRSTIGEATEGGREPTSPMPLLWDRVDWASVLRATWAVDVQAGVQHRVLLFDHAPAQQEATARKFDELVADHRERGIELREDEPWPGARRVTALGSEPKWWLAQRGSQLVFGQGDVPLGLGAPPDGAPGSHLRMTVLPHAQSAPQAATLDALVQHFGFGALDRVELRHRVDGAGYDESLVGWGERTTPVPEAPILTAAPRLPRFDGQFASARASFDPQATLATIADLVRRSGGSVDMRVAQHLAGIWAGPFAFGIAAPAMGRFYPRMTLGVRLKPGHDFLKWLEGEATHLELGVEVKEIDGVPTATITLAGMPPALRPACCVIDDVLWMAETAETLRALRKGLAAAEDVFADPDAAPCAVPAGAVVFAEAWFDCEACWARSGRVWGTALIRGAMFPYLDSPLWQVPPIVGKDDLPEADEVAATLGRGRAALFVAADRFGVQVTAPTLGPLLSLGGGIGLSFIPEVAAMAMETRRQEAAVQSTHARAVRLGKALRVWREQHGASPAAVADLVPLLPRADREPLVAPHGPDGDLATRRTWSFQIAPAGMTAAADLPTIPGQSAAPGQRLLPGAPRAVFAFCGFAYRGHHLLILEDGEVAWVRSEKLLRHLPGGK